MITYSIIQKSQLEGSHRLDAEYYQPEYLLVESKLKRINDAVPFDNLIQIITDGKHGGVTFVEKGVIFLRNTNIVNGAIDLSDLNYISEAESLETERAEVQPNDLLLTTIGTIGECAIVPNEIKRANINQNLVKIRLKKGYSPIFIYCFLNCKYGKGQTTRLSTGNVQPIINYSKIRKILIPLLPESIQLKVEEVVSFSHFAQTNSKKLYKDAEDLLLDELGLKDFKIEDDLSFVVTLSDVQSANRVDAEYFQPKYKILIKKVNLRNAKPLEQFINSYSTGFPFESKNYVEQGIPLIRINNIKKGYIDLGDTAFLTEKDQLLSPKDIAKSGDIVLSMSGTIGMTAAIPENIQKCSINQRILKFTPKNVETDYLTLVLNTIVGFYQLERIGTGGVQTNISYKDIKNILIPDLPKPTQQRIAELVRKSHEARKKSKELLEEAKRKVEEMVENG